MRLFIDNNVGKKVFNDLQKMGFDEIEYGEKLDRQNFAKFLLSVKGMVLVSECKELVIMCQKRGIKAIRMNPVATFVGLDECRPRSLRILNKLEDELFRLWMIAKIDLNYVINWTESMEKMQAHCDRMTVNRS